MLGTPVAACPQVDAGEEVFAAAEQDRGDGEMQYIDEAADEIRRMVATPPPIRTS